MISRFALLALVLSLTASSWAQGDIRSPDLNAESEDGALIAQAAISEDPQEKVEILEGFVGRFQESRYYGYALLQLQGLYNQAGQHDKVVEVGAKLLAIVPDDLEVRHNINQALVAQQGWDELGPKLAETRPIADKEASQTMPEDLYEDEEAEWQGKIDYAKGVVQYLEWATNAAMSQQTDPAKKVEWLDRLREGYPDGQYSKGLDQQYVIAYQQMGDSEKMVEAMNRAIEGGFHDENYYYTLAEHALGQQDNEAAQGYAEKALEVIAAKKPTDVEEEQWAKQNEKMIAYSNFVIGRAWVAKNNKPAFRTGRTHLLKTVDVLKAEGGGRYGVMAYMLGICYVQLDIGGDNIRKALMWMGVAASTESPVQAQAKQDLAKIKAAI